MTYSVAVTSFGCLALLSASEEPFEGDHGKALLRGLKFLLSTQRDGMFQRQGHTWIHGQGFATLALSEAYGRAKRCKVQPELDLKQVRTVLEKAVAVIAKNQSTSGGWWYTPGCPSQHEGSTTCCAVQALVSADNYGIAIDATVLEKGFEYLKRCQNPDGGFDYKMGPGNVSMKEGTAGGSATLGLMKKFDFAVMLNGFKFLVKIKAGTISRERFPFYGHFYGVMGMHLLVQEMDHLKKDADAFMGDAFRDLITWVREDGSWAARAWVKSDTAYATSFATLILSIPDGRLSIFNRDRPQPAVGK
jgi:hypothetical protein